MESQPQNPEFWDTPGRYVLLTRFSQGVTLS